MTKPQTFTLSHADDGRFVAQGLRAFFEYRQLGIMEPPNSVPSGILQKCQPPTAPWRGLLQRFILSQRFTRLRRQLHPLPARFAPTRSGAGIIVKYLRNLGYGTVL